MSLNRQTKRYQRRVMSLAGEGARFQKLGTHTETVAAQGFEVPNPPERNSAFREAMKATAWNASRPASRGTAVTGSLMGDPPAGRSALDQRGRA